MSGRLEAWIDEDDMERQDVAAIVKDRAITFKQLRILSLSDNDGFREQSPKHEYRLLREATGRLDRKNRTFAQQKSDDGTAVDVYFIITVYQIDVNVNDIFEYEGVQYKVTGKNRIGQSFTECEVEVTE